jgi:hypothetical protein
MRKPRQIPEAYASPHRSPYYPSTYGHVARLWDHLVRCGLEESHRDAVEPPVRAVTWEM